MSVLLKVRPARSQHQLLEFPRQRAVLGQEQVLGKLLGDGRATLRDAAMHQVGDRGAGDAQRIDAVVRIEAAILDGDEGLRHVARQLTERHRGAAHVAARRQHLAFEVDDLDVRRALGDLQ